MVCFARSRGLSAWFFLYGGRSRLQVMWKWWLVCISLGLSVLGWICCSERLRRHDTCARPWLCNELFFFACGCGWMKSIYVWWCKPDVYDQQWRGYFSNFEIYSWLFSLCKKKGERWLERGMSIVIVVLNNTHEVCNTKVYDNLRYGRTLRFEETLSFDHMLRNSKICDFIVFTYFDF